MCANPASSRALVGWRPWCIRPEADKACQPASRRPAGRVAATCSSPQSAVKRAGLLAGARFSRPSEQSDAVGHELVARAGHTSQRTPARGLRSPASACAGRTGADVDHTLKRLLGFPGDSGDQHLVASGPCRGQRPEAGPGVFADEAGRGRNGSCERNLIWVQVHWRELRGFRDDAEGVT
jgi:hypothetical protein